MIDLLPQWSVARDDGKPFSYHRTKWGAQRALHQEGDPDDLFVIGPWWPRWMLLVVCRVVGHRVRRSTAIWVRDRTRPPTRFDCSRCYAELGRSWDTFGNVVKYGSDAARSQDGTQPRGRTEE